MALLGGDNLDTARDFLGRAIDAGREASGKGVRRVSAAVRGAADFVAGPFVRPPRWMRPIARGLAPALKPVRKALAYFRPGGPLASQLAAGFYRNPLVKFISASLLRRVLFSNLIGFAILFIGILYLSLDSSWVINAKRDALRIQGQIIAAAIAGDANVTPSDFTLDPETIPGKEAAQVPLRDDGFAAMELSILPQRVAPILNRLIEPIRTRARIYDIRGILVIDSSMLLRKGQIVGPNEGDKPKVNTERPKTKNFWTRLQHWLIDREVQVYKEIGTANGKYYPEVRAALDGRTEAMLLLNRKGEQIVSMAVPIQRMGRVLGVLLLSTQPGEVDDILAKDREAIWPLAALALVAGIVTSLLMARTVAGPMKGLSETAELVRRDINAHRNLPSYDGRNDEVGQMARTFRSMTNALYERIEASKKFAADVAHELKNPLTAASSTAQALEYAKTDEQRDELVRQIQGELKRLNRLITDVSDASRLGAELARQSTDPVDIKSVLHKVTTIFEDKARDRGCQVLLKFSDEPVDALFVVNGNEGRIAQVFTNLVDNALSFTPDNSKVRIHARRDGDFVHIHVDDEGPGIEDDKLETIFTRFYTYRPDVYSSRGSNSGLGLSISNEIVRAHGGEIWAENRLVKRGPKAGKKAGARFVVRLPARPAPHTRGGATGASRA